MYTKIKAREFYKFDWHPLKEGGCEFIVNT